MPANNPRLADTKLGAALFQEIKVLRFLADNNAVTRYEGMLKFITDRGNVTRAEIETHYRSGIRDLVTEIMSEEFNRVSFRLYNFNAILTRNPQNGHYVLRYTDARNNTEELSAASLETLSSAMSRSTDFIQNDINQVRAQAALMPAVVLSNAALTEIIDILTRFYTEPNQSTYRAVLEATSILEQAVLNTRDTKYSHVPVGWSRSLVALNQELSSKVYRELQSVGSITTLSREQQRRLIQLR